MAHAWEDFQLPGDGLPFIRRAGVAADKCHFRTIPRFVNLGSKISLNHTLHNVIHQIDTCGSKLINNEYLHIRNNRADSKRSAPLLLIISGV